MDSERVETPAAIRDATTADASTISAIGRVAFPLVHEPLLGPELTAHLVDETYTESAVRDSIERCGSSPDAHFLVAERDGQVIGYLHYDSFGEEPELHRIYLDPEAKSRGVGSALIRELHDRLGPDASYVLMVAAVNETARRFYERHGLVEERQVDGTSFFAQHMGVALPESPRQVAAIVMRRLRRA